MLSTTNYGLQKPEPLIDNVNIDVINGNMDLVDKGLVIYLGTTSGSSNAYTIASEDIKALSDGLAISVKIHAASTAASTLNINGWGAKAIRKAGGTNVTNLKVGIYTMRYDGSSFILQGEGATGNAAASDLLLGKTATTDAGDITGTMPDIGPVTAETVNLTSQGQEYTIAYGKHSGLRKIKALLSGLVESVIKAGATVGGIAGTFTADATATASKLTLGETAYVNGAKITGNIPIAPQYPNENNASQFDVYSAPPNPLNGNHNVFLMAPRGYYENGTWLGYNEPNLKAVNIKAGVEIGGNAKITGTYTADANATNNDILATKTAYVNGAKITGNIPVMSTEPRAAAEVFGHTTSKRIYLKTPAGYFDGGSNSMVYAEDNNWLAANIKKDVSVFGLIGTHEGTKYASGSASILSTDTSPHAFYNVSGASASGTIKYIAIPKSSISFTPSAILVRGQANNTSLTIMRPNGIVSNGSNIWHAVVLNGLDLSVPSGNTTLCYGSGGLSDGSNYYIPVSSAFTGSSWEAFGQ